MTQNISLDSNHYFTSFICEGTKRTCFYYGLGGLARIFTPLSLIQTVINGFLVTGVQQGITGDRISFKNVTIKVMVLALSILAFANPWGKTILGVKVLKKHVILGMTHISAEIILSLFRRYQKIKESNDTNNTNERFPIGDDANNGGKLADNTNERSPIRDDANNGGKLAESLQNFYRTNVFENKDKWNEVLYALPLPSTVEEASSLTANQCLWIQKLYSTVKTNDKSYEALQKIPFSVQIAIANQVEKQLQHSSILLILKNMDEYQKISLSSLLCDTIYNKNLFSVLPATVKEASLLTKDQCLGIENFCLKAKRDYKHYKAFKKLSFEVQIAIAQRVDGFTDSFYLLIPKNKEDIQKLEAANLVERLYDLYHDDLYSCSHFWFALPKKCQKALKICFQKKGFEETDLLRARLSALAIKDHFTEDIFNALHNFYLNFDPNHEAFSELPSDVVVAFNKRAKEEFNFPPIFVND